MTIRRPDIPRTDRRPGRRLLTATVGVLGALALAACGGSSDSPAASSPSPSLSGVATYSGLARKHVRGTVDYPQSPPVGGPHSPVWMRCTGTVYAQPLRNENAVHSMEHGAVWVTYRPDLAPDQVAVLAADVQGKPYTMMSPYPGLSSPVVLTAWGTQLGVDSATDPRVAVFISTYANGPQTPEQGAPCTGGFMAR